MEVEYSLTFAISLQTSWTEGRCSPTWTHVSTLRNMRHACTSGRWCWPWRRCTNWASSTATSSWRTSSSTPPDTLSSQTLGSARSSCPQIRSVVEQGCLWVWSVLLVVSLVGWGCQENRTDGVKGVRWMGQWLSRDQDGCRCQGSQVNGTVVVKWTGQVVSRESGEWDSGCQENRMDGVKGVGWLGQWLSGQRSLLV